MKINRLEMLKANIGLELIAGHDELEKFMGGILKGRTEAELKRQAGILGKTIKNNAQLANSIVNGSFHNGTFSDRIWQYQDIMRQDLGKLLQQGLIQGKGARAIAKDLKKYWYGNDPKTGGGAKYCMERLMRTELARVQTEAQKQSFERNGFDMYQFICNVNPTKNGTCPVCRRLANQDKGLGKGVYLVADMMPGTNAPPMHPHCRCSTAAYEDDEEYEAWLDFLDKGGTTEEWNKKKKAVENSQNGSKIKLGLQFFARNSKDYKTIELPKQEYAHVMSELATHMTAAQRKQKVVTKAIGEYIYTIENNGFGNYRVIGKEAIDEDILDWWYD
jgi:SPP1 gp7 family putative phage head morphogenesis protein